MSSLDKKIERAVTEAEYAFWDVIAHSFPEAETGDMHIDVCIRFTDNLNHAVRLWLATNTDLLPDYWASFEDEEAEESGYWGGIPSSSSGSLVILPTETRESDFPLDE